MHTRHVCAALVLAAIPGITAAAAGEIQPVAAVRLHAQTRIAAPPAAVWKAVTTGRTFATWCPMWKAPSNAATTLTHVGDVVSFTDEWNNRGRSVVTFLAPGRELRVAHEPDDGSYLCQARIVLTPAAGGTVVQFWDAYTDDNPREADRSATAARQEAALERQLQALKQMVEKH